MKNRLPLQIEELESRLLLSANYSIEGRTLVYNGTDSVDNVEVYYRLTDLNGSIHSTLNLYATDQDNREIMAVKLDAKFYKINKIEFYGKEGNDSFENRTGELDYPRGYHPTLISYAYGDEGYDTLTGSSRTDYLYAGDDGGTLIGGDGNDKLVGGSADDRLFGGDGVDRIFGYGGNDFILGDGLISDPIGKKDLLKGGEGFDTIFGGPGNDIIYGGSGSPDGDRLTGGPGDDVIRGGSGSNEIYGGEGNDKLFGANKTDTIHGGGGADNIFGNGGDDFLRGGGINSKGPADVVTDTDRRDIIYGGKGHDNLIGHLGNDVLVGQAGDDELFADEGNDILSGGADNDTYFFKGNDLGSDEIRSTSGINTLDFRDHPYALKVDLSSTSEQRVSKKLKLKFRENGIDHVKTGNGKPAELTGNDLDNRFTIDAKATLIGGKGNDSYNTSFNFGTNGNFVMTLIFKGRDLGRDSYSGFYSKELNLDFRRVGGSKGLAGFNGEFEIPGELSVKGETSRLKTIKGTNRNDVIYGTSGDDIIYGFGGDDFLYGSGGRDQLYGGNGKDGLFGGADVDRLEGEQGSDRYLWQTGDGIAGFASDDARINFVNGDVDWADYEIIGVDGGLQRLHDATNNSRLLKTANGGRLKFKRMRESSSHGPGTYAVNLYNGTIELYTYAFSSHRTYSIDQTIVHEIGHNWDKNAGLRAKFIQYSGWIRSSTGVVEDAPGYNPNVQYATRNTDWWYVQSAAFASDPDGNNTYAKTNPDEDIAQTFFLYFFKGDSDFSSNAYPTLKVRAVRDLIRSL